MFRVLFLMGLMLLSMPCYALRTVVLDAKYQIREYDPFDEIPLDSLEKDLVLYYETYMNPKQHLETPFEEMGIDTLRFSSYEEFILDMFEIDFPGYQLPGERYYFQVVNSEDDRVIGICAILRLEPGFYFVEHIGIHHDFRREGLASRVLQEVIVALPDIVEISLDTRVFNCTAQKFYDNFGFQKLAMHPKPSKQGKYYHYIYKVN